MKWIRRWTDYWIMKYNVLIAVLWCCTTLLEDVLRLVKKMCKLEINIKKILLVYIIFYFFVMALYCGMAGPHLAGEWDDYSYPVVSIITRHHLSVQETDVPMLHEFYPQWQERIVSIRSLSNRYDRNNGGELSWYFPTYSIACVPLVLVLRLMGISAVYAFPYVNLLSVVFMLYIVCKYLDAKDITKLFLILLLSINPVIFYYRWVSAEAMIYAFLSIGLVFWHNKWYKRAAFFVSLAGTLNIVIMFVGIVMIIEYLVVLLCTKPSHKKFFQYIMEKVPEVIKYGACYVVGIIPPIYFYYHTGHINLTASHSGFWHGEGMAILQRAMAYLFDLNYGVLPYYSIVLCLGLIFFVVACIRKCWEYLEWFVTFLGLVVLYSIMVHINSGMSGIARYNVWGVALLLFSVCLFGEKMIVGGVVKKVLYGAIALDVVFAALIIQNYGLNAQNAYYTYMTPVARWVLNRAPALYNPLPSTFNSRVNQIDGGYAYELPVVYMAEDGYARKARVDLESAREFKDLYLSLADQDELEKKLLAVKDKEQYIEFSKEEQILKCVKYELGTPLLFAMEENTAEPYVAGGLHPAEEWGAWTKDYLVLRLRVDSKSEMIKGTIKCDVFNEKQTYIISVNQEEVANGVSNGQDIVFEFENPGAEKMIEISIRIPEAVSPFAIGQAEDTRVLGLGIKELIFEEK